MNRPHTHRAVIDHHTARKRFGQHFLADVAVIDAIVRAIAPHVGDHMVEIGPGLGALTAPLLERLDALTVVELDRDLAARMRGRAGVTVIEADVLKVDLAALQPPAAEGTQAPLLRICGNLPYNISSPILFHLLPWAARVRDQHFMLQKEVVDRMVAVPATKAYGRLSVMLQWRYAMENVLDVPASAFNPPPKVESAVVRMTPRADHAQVDVDLLSELVRVAFSQRRKLLRHPLGPWLETHRFAGDFDLRRRAEEVPVPEYIALAQQLAHGG